MRLQASAGTDATFIILSAANLVGEATCAGVLTRAGAGVTPTSVQMIRIGPKDPGLRRLPLGAKGDNAMKAPTRPTSVCRPAVSEEFFAGDLCSRAPPEFGESRLAG
eukprot:3733192-Pyramimonas_sp.AAC.1